jgi:anaerobic magnesium-protoporphyrin IX monomethyl ester cyclase
MKIALLSTPTRTALPNTVPPLGLLYLSSFLTAHGHDTRIIDIARTRQPNTTIIDELKEYQPDLIAVSGIITAYQFIHALVREVKGSLPQIPLVIGGHIALDNRDLLLKSVGCDYVIVGYGERKILALVEHLEGRREIADIPGLSFLEAGSVRTNPGDLFFRNIDEIPLPAYDRIDMEYYVTVDKEDTALARYLATTGKTPPAMRSFFVIAARGCTDRCTFCVHEFDHKGFHVHSTDYVRENIRVLYEKYGVRVFHFGEDLFIYKAAQAAKLVEMMNTHFPEAFFSIPTRADFVTPELLGILKNSNCYVLLYGFESGNNDILKILGKRIVRETNITAYNLISATPIVPECSFMVGSPGETKATIRDTIDAIRQTGMPKGGIFFTTPYPGSRLWRWCIEKGRIPDVESYLFAISDRDASVLSYNFTPYPDSIVRMMYILVQNQFRKNLESAGAGYTISLKDRLLRHVAIPALYESYFVLRRGVSVILPHYRETTIPYEINSWGTIRLCSDKT